MSDSISELKQRAIAAGDVRTKENRQRTKRRQDKKTAEIVKVIEDTFGVRPACVVFPPSPDHPLAVLADDLRLGVLMHSGRVESFLLLSHGCETCGPQFVSAHFQTLAGLGQALTAREATPPHQCPAVGMFPGEPDPEFVYADIVERASEAFGAWLRSFLGGDDD